MDSSESETEISYRFGPTDGTSLGEVLCTRIGQTKTILNIQELELTPRGTTIPQTKWVRYYGPRTVRRPRVRLIQFNLVSTLCFRMIKTVLLIRGRSSFQLNGLQYIVLTLRDSTLGTVGIHLRVTPGRYTSHLDQFVYFSSDLHSVTSTIPSCLLLRVDSPSFSPIPDQWPVHCGQWTGYSLSTVHGSEVISVSDFVPPYPPLLPKKEVDYTQSRILKVVSAGRVNQVWRDGLELRVLDRWEWDSLY